MRTQKKIEKKIEQHLKKYIIEFSEHTKSMFPFHDYLKIHADWSVIEYYAIKNYKK